LRERPIEIGVARAQLARRFNGGRKAMTKSLKVALVAALVLTVGAATVAVATGSRWSARTTLSGYEEVPAISTSGGGTFRASINRAGTQISFKLTYGNLVGAVTQAHIHFGQLSVNGGIMVFLCSNLGNGPVGTAACPPSGSVSGTITAANVVGAASAQGIAAGEFAEVVKAIRHGVAYANVHSTLYPGGEIRGQLRDRDH
jgi:hypothetical protein